MLAASNEIMAELSIHTGAETKSSGVAKWGRLAGGWLLVLVGLSGFVLPVIPGIPLILAGLAVLAKDYAWARLAQQKVKAQIARIKQWFMRRSAAA